MTEHEHAEAIQAFKEGKEIEFRVKPEVVRYGSKNEWFPCKNPDWHHNFEYRIKNDA